MVKAIKKNPSIRLKELLVYAKKINIKVSKNKNRSSTRTIRILDFKGIISEIIPKISPILAMLLPIILPRAKSGFNLTAFKQVKSSGREVATETIVKPTNR